MKKVFVAAALLRQQLAPGWTGSYGGIEGGWGSSAQTDPGIPVFTSTEGPSNSEGPLPSRMATII
jgi:hypothetical protein